ncbi:MAG: hypothetical protein GF383_07595 [Candidatus Lokiarchaeota archaeon]|nr:hypothetical protein [Candidatus Lokiarchaeota archaeon]MBD3340114.1 hypothetical protein [Candidatus Lokiarchaeota archaeon]
MKIIIINIPDSYIKALSMLSERNGETRSELIRKAIGRQLEIDLEFKNNLAKSMEGYLLELERREELRREQEKRRKEIEKKRKIAEFYNYCISCDAKLHRKPSNRCFNDFKILEIRFCCRCYKRYQDFTFDEFPISLQSKIKRKINNYKKYLRRKARSEKD